MGTRDPIYDVDELEREFARWAEGNGCSPTPMVEEIPLGRDVTRYDDCDGDDIVELSVLHGVDHSSVLEDCSGTVWGFCTEFPIDMAAVVTDFFEQYALPDAN